MNRHELTDQQWEHIAPLLPPERTGKREMNDRPMERAIQR
jgi:transposase